MKETILARCPRCRLLVEVAYDRKGRPVLCEPGTVHAARDGENADGRYLDMSGRTVKGREIQGVRRRSILAKRIHQCGLSQ